MPKLWEPEADREERLGKAVDLIDVFAVWESRTLGEKGFPEPCRRRKAGHQTVFIRTRGQLAFLSPKIQAAIRDGTHPTELTLKRILARPVPLDWTLQDQLHGFS